MKFAPKTPAQSADFSANLSLKILRNLTFFSETHKKPCQEDKPLCRAEGCTNFCPPKIESVPQKFSQGDKLSPSDQILAQTLNDHLFIVATFFSPQGSHCGEVQLHFELVTYRLNFFKGIPHPWRVWATSSCIWQITVSTRRMKELISQTLMKLFARDTNGISFLVTSLSVYNFS